MSSVSLSHVTKDFDGNIVLSDFSATFNDCEFITLLGPSGCGKTTTLRMIAGFVRPSQGTISIDGKVVSDNKIFIPPEERGIGMVFQSYAVWPHMTVAQNIGYPLKIQKKSTQYIKERTEEMLDAVHLSGLGDRMPDQLSGGQQQRIALGRALIARPNLLLLDEPLSNLDARLRETMRLEIKSLQKQFGVTVIYVTHDHNEALSMSDRIVVMKDGYIQQVGSPKDIYDHPVNSFVADFVGKVSYLPGLIQKDSLVVFGKEIGQYRGNLSGEVIIACRPENIERRENGTFQGKVLAHSYFGKEHEMQLLCEDSVITCTESPRWAEETHVGDMVSFEISQYFVFPRNEKR